MWPFSRGWCGSVDWALACELKGHWFDYQSEHTSGLWARSPVGGVQEATTHWCSSPSFSLSLPLSKKKILFILFLDGGEEREKERERNINVWLPVMCPLLGTWPATQACALTGNWTSNPLVHSLMLNPLSHTSLGSFFTIYNSISV